MKIKHTKKDLRSQAVKRMDRPHRQELASKGYLKVQALFLKAGIVI